MPADPTKTVLACWSGSKTTGGIWRLVPGKGANNYYRRTQTVCRLVQGPHTIFKVGMYA